MEADLTHAQAVEAFKAFATEVGPHAAVIVGLNASHWARGEEALHVSIYPRGVGYDSTAHADADTYAELLSRAKTAWNEQGDARAAKLIRDMALAVISITADEGACSELSLCRAFSAGEVKAYGDRACEEATRIAGNGPFSIVRAAAEAEAA